MGEAGGREGGRGGREGETSGALELHQVTVAVWQCHSGLQIYMNEAETSTVKLSHDLNSQHHPLTDSRVYGKFSSFLFSLGGSQ